MFFKTFEDIRCNSEVDVEPGQRGEEIYLLIINITTVLLNVLKILLI